ncbi:MAG: mechanosensitive ion channel [Desulfobacterales bacterium]|nr:mechanosensitive ion channel [Desulfobacterales bacterium]MDX2512154.1 mechanosensitive ion channel [Desulfobacterales bacterium]
MRKTVSTILGIVLLWVVFLVPGNVSAAWPQKKAQPADAELEPEVAVPDLAKIIPLSAELSGLFARLQNNLNQGDDFSSIEMKYAAIAAELEESTRTFDQLKETAGYKIVQLRKFREDAANQKFLLAFISKPLITEIRRIDSWKTEWLSEKRHWEVWQPSLLKDQSPEQIKQVFRDAQKTIDTGLELVLQRLETMLVLQAKGSDVTKRLDVFDVDLRAALSIARREYLYKKAPPLLSVAFISHFRGELWSVVLEDLRGFSWPGVRFFRQYGWNFLVQLCCILLVIGAIYRNRDALRASENWKFLADRPVASALFITIATLALFVAYSPFMGALRLAYTIVGGLACVRLLSLVVDQPWKKQAVYGVMIVHIFSELLIFTGAPLPLSRLWIFLASLVGLYFLVRWARKYSTLNEAGFYIWLFRAVGVFFVVIIIAQIWGNAGIAVYLFRSMIKSMALTLPYIFFIYLIYGGLRWVFYTSPVWRVKLLRSDAQFHVQRISFLFVAAIIGFALLPGILVAWGLYDNLPEATTHLYSLGLSIGALRISAGMVVTLAGVIYGVFLASRILPKVLLDETISGQKLSRGVQRSIGQLIRYGIIFVGFLLTFMILGFDFTKITIILSALSVGIGFGLQGVVNNFICGLILLFERPLTEGDTIEIGTGRAYIRKIGLRATIVRTMDEADLIIPNKKKVVNRFMWSSEKSAKACVRPIHKRKREFAFTPMRKIFCWFGAHTPGLFHFLITRFGTPGAEMLDAS